MSDLSTGEPLDGWKGNAATRCVAHKRTACGAGDKPDAAVCDWHGARAPQVKAKARQRIEEAANRMAKQLLGIAESAESEAVKLAAVKDALDRAGLKPPTTVDVSLGPPKPYEELISGLTSMTRAESRAARGVPDDTPRAPWSRPAIPRSS